MRHLDLGNPAADNNSPQGTGSGIGRIIMP
jgi:hypothetical protein